MKLTEPKTESQGLNECPFIQELILCGINALIEVLELPVEKLILANTAAIARKLLEISGDKEAWLTSEGQLLHLQCIITKLCEDRSILNRVMTLSEQKFDSFLKEELM